MDLVAIDSSHSETFASRSRPQCGIEDRRRSAFRDLLIRAFARELRAARVWLARRPEIRVFNVPYAGLVREPVQWAREVARFLDGGDAGLDEAAMAAAVAPSLYRHRSSDTGGGLP